MTTTVQHRVPISQIIYKVPRTYFQEVVDATLARRGELSQGARESLDSAIRARVRLTGFRDASKADANLLGPQVLALCDLGDDRLAGALLRAWTEVEGELHRTVAEHLEERGIPSPGPNLKDRCFEDCWPVAEWEEQVQQILDKSPDLDGSAVALMVCLASGRAPEGDGADLAVASPVLNEWIEKLTDMKSEDPEWDEIFSFMRIVGEIAEGKAAERSAEQLDQLKSKLPEIAGDFGDELGYLEIDLDPEAWAMKALGSGRRLEDVLVLAGDLGEWLAEYRKIRPQAESRQQEIERQEARADHEKAILAIAREWGAWSMPPEETDDEAPPEGRTRTAARSRTPGPRRATATRWPGWRPSSPRPRTGARPWSPSATARWRRPSPSGPRTAPWPRPRRPSSRTGTGSPRRTGTSRRSWRGSPARRRCGAGPTSSPASPT